MQWIDEWTAIVPHWWWIKLTMKAATIIEGNIFWSSSLTCTTQRKFKGGGGSSSANEVADEVLPPMPSASEVEQQLEFTLVSIRMADDGGKLWRNAMSMWLSHVCNQYNVLCACMHTCRPSLTLHRLTWTCPRRSSRWFWRYLLRRNGAWYHRMLRQRKSTFPSQQSNTSTRYSPR